jgi:hypothetical protein
MEDICNKLNYIIAALISALGGYVLYERQKIDNRLTSLETADKEHKAEIAVLKESLNNLKGDTEEIKESQKAIIELLTASATKRKR